MPLHIAWAEAAVVQKDARLSTRRPPAGQCSNGFHFSPNLELLSCCEVGDPETIPGSWYLPQQRPLHFMADKVQAFVAS